jgi:hypothetical protein
MLPPSLYPAISRLKRGEAYVYARTAALPPPPLPLPYDVAGVSGGTGGAAAAVPNYVDDGGVGVHHASGSADVYTSRNSVGFGEANGGGLEGPWYRLRVRGRLTRDGGRSVKHRHRRTGRAGGGDAGDGAGGTSPAFGV